MLNDTGAFGVSARDQLRAQAPAAGINVVAWEEFQPADNDLTTQLTRIRGTSAQAIICWTVTPAGVVFLKNAQPARPEADARPRLRLRGRPLHAARRRRLRGPAISRRSSSPWPSSSPTAIPSRPPSSTTRRAIAPSTTRTPTSTADRRGTASAWSRTPSPARAAASATRSAPGSRVHQGVQGRRRRVHVLAAEALGARQERRRDDRVAPGQVPAGRSRKRRRFRERRGAAAQPGSGRALVAFLAVVAVVPWLLPNAYIVQVVVVRGHLRDPRGRAESR